MPNLYNAYHTREGHYYIGNDDTQTQVFFNLREDAPFESKYFGVVVDEFPYEYDSVYDCAVALKERVDRYLIHSDKNKMKILVDYLEQYIYRDVQAKLKQEKERLEIRIIGIDKELGNIQHLAEMEENDRHE